MKELIAPDRPALRRAMDQGCGSWRPVCPASPMTHVGASVGGPLTSAAGQASASADESPGTVTPQH